MRFIILAMTFFAINSWAGLQVRRCSNGNNNAIRLCIELNRQLGKLDISAERIALQFSGETKLTSEFILPSTGSLGTVEVFREEAILQIADGNPIYLTCELPKPGYCK